MSSLLSRIWFPVAAVSIAAANVGMNRMPADSRLPEPEGRLWVAEAPAPSGEADTVTYSIYGYRFGWNENDFEIARKHKRGGFSADSLSDSDSLFFGDERKLLTRPVGLDTIVPPDSLFQTDTFRFKYFAALKDSLCHVWVRDSLKRAKDTLTWLRLDSLYAADSVKAARIAFQLWYASLDKAARKKYDMERKVEKKMAQMDSLRDVTDSIKTLKDSIRKATPRLLETFALPDTHRFERITSWTHDRDFHKMEFREIDTTSDYHFNDYPFFKEDVNATWLGVAGSPVQYYNFFKRKSTEGVSFYEAQESWSLSPGTLPMYNTKTAHTELAYWGTILDGNEKESDNIRIFTTQNFTPRLNVTFEFNRYGGGGMLQGEKTKNKTMAVSGNYLGKRYLMHTGYIYNMVSREENGGLSAPELVQKRDTTVDSREVPVHLAGASSLIKKNTFFLDQQYRIPFRFLKRDKKDSTSVTDSLPPLPAAPEPGQEGEAGQKTDSLAVAESDLDVTTAFIGHSSEYSVYYRLYNDNLNSEAQSSFYGDIFNFHPVTTMDSLRVGKFDNKVFLRLQPWSSTGIVSKLDVGAGEKILNYYSQDPRMVYKATNHRWTSTYLYAGAEGQLKDYIAWDAKAKFSLLGDEAGDTYIGGNLHLNFFPFRRYRNSPVCINAHLETSLREPEYYQQHFYGNHFKWDNDFGKISSTIAQADISVPRWDIRIGAGYALLDGNIWYDKNGTVRQNGSAMSVLSGTLDSKLHLGPLHLDHRILAQVSSNEEVIPLPMISVNARYYLQLIINKVLKMQIGANVLYNTAWYAPAWNPEVGVFHNQSSVKYGNCPYFDPFLNLQWKRACIFIKYENAGQGWPMDKADYFSAHNYIRTQRAFKLGFFWPFYVMPGKDDPDAKNPPSDK